MTCVFPCAVPLPPSPAGVWYTVVLGTLKVHFFCFMFPLLIFFFFVARVFVCLLCGNAFPGVDDFGPGRGGTGEAQGYPRRWEYGGGSLYTLTVLLCFVLFAPAVYVDAAHRTRLTENGAVAVLLEKRRAPGPV